MPIDENRLKKDIHGEQSQEYQKHSQMLGQIAVEVEEFCEHPDCTTLEAVILMKCRLKELEAQLKRAKIYRGWED
jgi:hypothetical protein